MPIYQDDKLVKRAYTKVRYSKEQMDELIGHSNLTMAGIAILAQLFIQELKITDKTPEQIVASVLEEARKLIKHAEEENLKDSVIEPSPENSITEEVKQPRSYFTLEELREGLGPKR